MSERMLLWMLKHKAQRGQGMAEYGIAIAAVVIVVWAAMKVLGVNISGFITGIASHF
ncbi:MAG TPA: Flp family type IVb pilin [Chloroflexi bacterium]|nr:Flp family type IVb pilin [Chloroflexota bacterium]